MLGRVGYPVTGDSVKVLWDIILFVEIGDSLNKFLKH